MISACEDAGVGLFVAYYRRAMPRFATVKELLDQWPDRRAAVGHHPQRAAGAEWARTTTGVGGWIRQISGGGHFVDLGSHTLDLLDWLLGPVTHASGVATNRGGRYLAEDLVTGVFRFRSGVQGVGVWNYDSFRYKDQVEIIGTEGALSFSCFASEPLRLVTARRHGTDRGPIPGEDAT